MSTALPKLSGQARFELNRAWQEARRTGNSQRIHCFSQDKQNYTFSTEECGEIVVEPHTQNDGIPKHPVRLAASSHGLIEEGANSHEFLVVSSLLPSSMDPAIDGTEAVAGIISLDLVATIRLVAFSSPKVPIICAHDVVPELSRLVGPPKFLHYRLAIRNRFPKIYDGVLPLGSRRRALAGRLKKALLGQ